MPHWTGSFKSLKTTQKRQSLALIFSNLELDGAKLRYTLAEPFASFVNVGSYHEWLGRQDFFAARFNNLWQSGKH